MKPVYKRQAYMGTVGDIKTLERHFSLMAERGWMIDKIGMYSHRYRAIEPSKIQFFIDFLPQVTMFDYPEDEGVQDYRRKCEESGWTFIAANKQIQVFSAQADTNPPAPVYTDNKAQARIYLKASLKYELPIFVLCLPVFYLLFPARKGIELFLSDISFFQTIGFFFFMVAYLWSFGFIVQWFLRTLRSAMLDLPMPVTGYRSSLIRGRVFVLCTNLYLIFVFAGLLLEVIDGMPVWIMLPLAAPLAGFGAGLLIRRRINTKRRERGENIRMALVGLLVLAAVIFIVSFMLLPAPRLVAANQPLGDRPALTLSDFGVEAPAERTFLESHGSVAVPVNYYYWEISRQGNVSTHVYRSVSKSLSRGLYNNFAETYQSNYHGNVTYLDSDEAAQWGADEGAAAFAFDGNNVLLLLKDKTILIIDFPFNIDGLDMDAVANAVRGLWVV